MSTIVSIRLTVHFENHGSYWSAWAQEGGHTVYGSTKAEARRQIEIATDVLVLSFKGNTKRLRNYLDQQQIKHFLRTGDAKASAKQIEYVESEILFDEIE